MKKLFIHVQHLLGIGHYQRMALLARQATSEGLAVTLASGGRNVRSLDIGAAHLIQLPPAYSDATFSTIFDEDGHPVSDRWWDQRTEMLLRAFDEARPDGLLIEMYPFGRRAFRRELSPLIVAAKKRSIPVLCSVRDVLVHKAKPSRHQETADIIMRDFDLVLVHGSPELIAFNFSLLRQIENKIRYTGYVGAKITAPISDGPEILVSAGGGAVGSRLLTAVLQARRQTSLNNQPWRIITGPNISDEEYSKIQALSDDCVVVEKFRSDFIELMAQCRMSISQGGYNTILEILGCRKRALVIPFADNEENEQELRARALAEKNILQVLSSDQLDLLPETIERTASSTVPPFILDMDGAATSIALIKDIL